jgi:NhaP-type Na+/H+ or K+/H+ antiporter
MAITEAGALVFGLVVGYVTYRTLIRTSDKSQISDLAAVISALGGGAVTKLYDAGSNAFAYYAFGLAIGMAAYFVIFAILNGKDTAAKLMGAERVNGRRTEQSVAGGVGGATSNHGGHGPQG